jgi:hypothetical protein
MVSRGLGLTDTAGDHRYHVLAIVRDIATRRCVQLVEGNSLTLPHYLNAEHFNAGSCESTDSDSGIGKVEHVIRHCSCATVCAA